MIKVYDNFLPYDVADMQAFVLTSPNISWKISEVVSPHLYNSDNDTNLNFQFMHKFLDARNNDEIMINKNTFPYIKDLTDKIDASEWFRIKMNLNLVSSKIIEHGFHIDNYIERDDAYTGIYYVNNNNGYTLFENGEKIESVFNRFVVFPANMQHTGTTCTDMPMRIVINFNFYRDHTEY